MSSNIYKSELGELDLSKLTRLYPAVVIDMHGEVAEMSLEWVELYGDKVKVLKYILVFDFTPINSDKKERTVFEFETKDALMQRIEEVAKLFD